MRYTLDNIRAQEKELKAMAKLLHCGIFEVTSEVGKLIRSIADKEKEIVSLKEKLCRK
jgi:hypothetical protein